MNTNTRNALLTIALSVGITGLSAGIAWSSGDGLYGRQATPANSLYQEECGSCHMAYPPRLLPSRSWDRIMGSLADHFGDNAELDAETQKAVNAFLDEHANNRWGSRVKGIRISETAWFRRRHHELPRRVVEGNPKVKSFSNCNACHLNAVRGDFDEDSIRIPGIRRGWDRDDD